MESIELDLPSECGVMLLGGTALFPHSSMDLHIFENRYRAMLRQCIEGSFMFAMGTLYEPEDQPYESCVSPIGTIGLIKVSRSLKDGCSNIILTGIKPVRFEQWIDESPYPKAIISEVERDEIDPYEAKTIRSLIIDSVPDHLTHLPSEIHDSVMEEFRSIENLTALIDSISHNFIADSDLRYELLAETNDSNRASKLLSALSL